MLAGLRNGSGIDCYANATMQAVLSLAAVKAALTVEAVRPGNALVREAVLRILREEVRSCGELISAVSKLGGGRPS
jgi:hypothetical protein